MTARLGQKTGGVDGETAGFNNIGLDDRFLRRNRYGPPPVVRNGKYRSPDGRRASLGIFLRQSFVR
jgi:hypothetical protein